MTPHPSLRLFALALLPAALGAQIDPFYQGRELGAPPAIKAKLETLRSVISSGKLRYQVGYTSALERPLESLTGLTDAASERTAAKLWHSTGMQLLDLDQKAEDEFRRRNPAAKLPIIVTPSASAAAFDWRRLGKVPPVRDQKLCGSCWAFSVVGAWECSNLIRNNVLADAAEEMLLSCAQSGTCTSGKRVPSCNYFVSHGVCSEKDWPYTAYAQACSTAPGTAKPGTYRMATWALINPDGTCPTVAQIKQALVQHGPVSTVLQATPALQAYTGGVFSEHPSPENLNHAVVIVGWDDAKGAWLMRNSWGNGWGETCGFGSERGYAWIAYDSSYIGNLTIWVRAAHAAYPISQAAAQLIKQIVVKP